MYIYKCFYKGYIISFLFDRSTMSWTENKDTFLMRDGCPGNFSGPAGSRDRGNIWQTIAQNLNCHRGLFQAWTSRGVRDRFTLTSRRLKAKNAQELKGTGGGGEQQTEYELLLEEMIQPSDESDKKKEAEAQRVRKKHYFGKAESPWYQKTSNGSKQWVKARTEDQMEMMKTKKDCRNGDQEVTLAWERKGRERERDKV